MPVYEIYEFDAREFDPQYSGMCGDRCGDFKAFS